MGCFFGLKLHLVCNELGELVAFKITSGNIADNNHETLKFLEINGISKFLKTRKCRFNNF